MHSHRILPVIVMAALLGVVAALLGACVGGGKGATSVVPPPPTANTVAILVDAGPVAGSSAINRPYVTVKVCVPGSTSQCASIDHVLLDTASFGLRLDRAALAAAALTTLTAETDSQGMPIEECQTFGAGRTWGPVVLADVTLAGEVAAKLPMQIIEDQGAGSPPAACSANGLQQSAAGLFLANGVLGVGVFAQDCGPACVSAANPTSTYYGCTSAGSCTAENVALTAQVTNPVAAFPGDNNGIIVALPDLQNANGDPSVQGTLYFGIATQSDNALPLSGLIVLGTDTESGPSPGEFRATYNGMTTVLPAYIDSGTEAYSFDAAINACQADPNNPNFNFVGYYCPAVAPLAVFAVNSGVGANNATNTVNFAVADPHTFVQNAAAFRDLGNGGGSTAFAWGMPFFYGRKVYVGLDQKTAGNLTGPYFAY